MSDYEETQPELHIRNSWGCSWWGWVLWSIHRTSFPIIIWTLHKLLLLHVRHHDNPLHHRSHLQHDQQPEGGWETLFELQLHQLCYQDQRQVRGQCLKQLLLMTNQCFNFSLFLIISLVDTTHNAVIATLPSPLLDLVPTVFYPFQRLVLKLNFTCVKDELYFSI